MAVATGKIAASISKMASIRVRWLPLQAMAALTSKMLACTGKMTASTNKISASAGKKAAAQVRWPHKIRSRPPKGNR
jgi:hypothetical protein